MQGKSPSPLFEAPWVTVDIFRRDWLHASDQGVAADFAGNTFKFLSTKFPGNNKKARVQHLFEDLCAWYDRNATPYSERLPCLTPAMIQADKKSPKLRGNAGIIRAIVPYLEEATRVRCNPAIILEDAVRQAASDLKETYDALRSDNIFHAYVMQRHSRRFALQYVALAKAHDGTRDWKLKPKLHVWLELCNEQGRPSKCWTYRDEDYGGGVARMSRRRGGQATVTVVSRQVVDSFRVKQPIVRILSA